MMWRYMAGKRVHHYGDWESETTYDIREYYATDDDFTGVTAAGMCPSGETRDELATDLRRMLADLEDGLVWDDETDTVVQE